MSVWDVVNQDPFSLQSLTLAMVKAKYTPGQLGASGLFEEAGVISTEALIEELNELIDQAAVKPRGAPGGVVTNDKRKIHSLRIPHIPQSGRITADEIRALRQFGQEAQMVGIESMRNKQLEKMRRQADYAIEAHRVVALKGSYINVNGDSVSANTLFGTVAASSISLALNVATTALRTKCAEIIQAAEEALDGNTYSEINIQCDKTLWNLLIDHAAVKETYLGYVGAAERAGQIMGSFVFGEIRWHRYRGNSAVSMGTKAAYAYPTGVAGMFITRFAPSTWLDSIGAEGMPYYSKAIETPEGDAIALLSQSNPLNICTRPNAIIPLTTP